MSDFLVPYTAFAPEWSHQGHSHQDALALGLASMLVYLEEDYKITSQLQQWGFRQFEMIRVKKGRDIDTYGFVASNGQVILVVFRGSVSSENWLANLQTVTDPGPFEKTLVHEGFQDMLFPALLALNCAIESMQTANQPLWITGHSLGGALAVLFSAMLLEHRTSVSGLYTFAAPRVGNYAFSKQLDQAMNGAPHFRYVNENDLVPHLPPEPFFSHAGTREILFADQEALPSEDQTVWVKLKQTFVAWYTELTDRDIQPVAAHKLDTKDGYLPRLLKAAQRA